MRPGIITGVGLHFAKHPAPANIDELLVAFVLEALGNSTDAVVRSPKPAPFVPPDPSVYGGSSAELETTSTWQVESASCAVVIERTNTFFPGDVNEPVREAEYIRVTGTRRDGSANVTIHASVGDQQMTFSIAASRSRARRQDHRASTLRPASPRRYSASPLSQESDRRSSSSRAATD